MRRNSDGFVSLSIRSLDGQFVTDVTTFRLLIRDFVGVFIGSHIITATMLDGATVIHHLTGEHSLDLEQQAAQQ